MNRYRTRALLCDRTREWAALAVDAELSEFEQALMKAHVERCAECHAFAQDVEEITEQLRAAPLEHPAAPVTLPDRSRVPALRRVQLAAAAAAVVAVTVFGGLAGLLPVGGDVGRDAAAPRSTSLDSQLRELRRETLPARRDVGAFKPPVPLI